MPQVRHLSEFQRVLSAGAAIVLASGLALVAVQPATAASTSPCVDGSTPDMLSTVSCNTAGSYTLTVPAGVTSIGTDIVGAGGGAGYPARAHIGGDAAVTSGILTLPVGTKYLYVIVGSAGTGDNHGTSTGGGASAVLATDASHTLLAKLAIAGGGGGGAYNGDGGDAGSAGDSDNAQTVSGPGQAGIGAAGGAGGMGNYSPGTSGGNDSPSTTTVAAGGTGGAVPGGATGGGGGGGYAGGGGGGGSRGSILSSNVAGGGGGSSLASGYLRGASITVLPGTGGVQLPGLIAGDGATGRVVLTFNGIVVPTSPSAVSATAGDTQASVSFTAPPNDGGSPITGYTVTSNPDGNTATCAASPCVTTGLTNGTAYTFTVHATNTLGNSPESAASAPVTPATTPEAPTNTVATFGDTQASVSFTAPASDGGSPTTSYTVTSNPSGITATCSVSPCVVTGLTNGTPYRFTVHATNTLGNSPESAASAPVTPATTPAAPTNAVATFGDTQASVSFTAPASDGGSPLTGYTVTSNPDGNTATCSVSPCVVTGLTNGTPYRFTVHATNNLGNSPESPATLSGTPQAPITAPKAPSGLSIVTTDTSLTVSFTAPDAGRTPITGYEISLNGGITWVPLTTTTSGTTVTGTTTGLDPKTAYNVRVRAVNTAGTGDASPSDNVTTRPAQPTVPTISTETTAPASTNNDPLALTGSNAAAPLLIALFLLLGGLIATRIGRARRQKI